MQEQSESDLKAQRRREQCRIYAQHRREKHRDQCNESARKYRQKNIEKIRERERKRSKTPERREYDSKRKRERYHRDPEVRRKNIEHGKKWRLANPEKNKAIARACYWRNRVSRLANARKKRLDLKTEVFRLLGNKCVRCGFTDVRALQVDHVHGGGVKELRSLTKNIHVLVLESIRRGEQKYQLLCANCNWIKVHENHEREGS